MTEKTCGTCSHCVKRHGPTDPMANRVCLHMGCLINDHDTCNCAGLYYDERADSIEQLAQEMSGCIIGWAAMLNEVKGYTADDTSVYPMATAKYYVDRLRALEVI